VRIRHGEGNVLKDQAHCERMRASPLNPVECEINASNSGAESWTGIGVVAGFWAVGLIRQGPHGKKSNVHWRSGLLQRLQEVRSNCKTRNQLVMRRAWNMRRGVTNLHASAVPTLRTTASHFPVAVAPSRILR
jgi:hypothetical protein